ncbi:SDR family NAD(P)-dependent oxidoreductase [Micromonospora mangrovi]|uniref:Type I polyketide synthase n=2 Tax=Micromonospora TaxID=1873 RepID=A0AAU7M7P9_9ACTN
MTRIAIIGMSCRYPDATSPRELWENALAGRRAFRRLPDERMRLDDYYDPDPATPDKFYVRNAAVIEGYEFDRVAYKVAGSTYRSTDLTHWLALDMAALALADAGFPMADGLPRERTSVVVGNSLTGEFTRAGQLRLRWPYVRRMMAAALKEEGWDDDRLATFLGGFEAMYKEPFPPVGEDSLAGALANTIAGRICNYFDLKGGGYTVDGACSSSLLSVATACRSLLDGDVDVAVAGGVDLSIDPLEMVGFAKTGALATGEMRIYDRGSNGFWPGEGCGMLVLMREPEARAAGHRIYATVAGWGISSDGKGGITRPEVDGYRLALRRAYERSGFGIDTVALFEGHGTGTKVGDQTELSALAAARAAARPAPVPAAVGSIKGMIGHAKAAAGVAGLIKATMAVHHGVLPPAIGCVDPHEILAGDSPLRALRTAEEWPAEMPLRAGVTAMGFGGINVHVVLENPTPRRRQMNSRHRAIAGALQDAELLAVDAAGPDELREKLAGLTGTVRDLSYAQLADLAAQLHGELRNLPYRAAVVAARPEQAVQRLDRLVQALDAGETHVFAPGHMLGHVTGPARIGFLFPGQGSGRGVSGGALRRRFPEAAAVYERSGLAAGADAVATEVAQPRIVTGSVAGLRALSALGIDAAVAVGHSLGELSALHWAGALDEDGLLRIAGVRGRTMARHSSSGTMAGIAGSAEAVAGLVAGIDVVIAGYNGPEQTVIAGTEEAVEEACRLAAAGGLTPTRLRVSHAFHSPLVAPAADAFAAELAAERFAPVHRRVVSTVTAEPLAGDTDVADLLRRQITEPVLFSQAVALAAKDIDLLVEVGPGHVLADLAGAMADVPAYALDTDNESIAGLLGVVGAAFVVGAAGIDATLFDDRLVRPLRLDRENRFLANPCEAAPALGVAVRTPVAVPSPSPSAQPETPGRTGESTQDLLRRLAAERAELPLEMIGPDSRLLDDLHLSSITVGQVVNQAAQQLDVPVGQLPTNFAVATIREVAEALDSLDSSAVELAARQTSVAGAAPWARAWRIDEDEAPVPARTEPREAGEWRVFAADGHPYASELAAALRQEQLGAGVLICLPKECTEADLSYALAGAQAAATGGNGRLVLVQHGPGAAGIVKTAQLESPGLRTTVVRLADATDAVSRVVAEVASNDGFREVGYDAAGQRRQPVLRAMPVAAERPRQLLDDSDVLLVTGGGKGITAECALAVASDSGAALAVLGRSDPATDAELAANLERLAAGGLTVRYARADVTDPAQVRRAVTELTAELGPVTAVLHGAGRNEPAALTSVTPDVVRRTFAPKVDGLAAVLDSVEASGLKLLVTLGSIIGRAGLRGEAHYAAANEWLAARTEEFGRANPGCRAVCLEWSVWSGVGMGERLSVVESLEREGVTPVTPEQGLAVLRRILADPDAPATVVVSGRTLGIDTVRYDLPELPLLRFVGEPLLRYPGVELVTEVELSAGTDLYLADHRLDGNLLFPAVFGMEAMAQVAAAVTGRAETPVVEDAQFLRPIVVPPDGSTRIRIAATVVADDAVAVAIRSAETLFAADHFTATLRYGVPVPSAGLVDQVPEGLPPVELHPADDLYGSVLFQGDRFHRLRTYHGAAAKHVDADLATDESVHWFATYLPGELLLGDPGTRDALMHGTQICVPDATLLPAGVRRIVPAGPALGGSRTVRYSAVERFHDGDDYEYDVELRDADGAFLERWEGLRLRAVRKLDGRGPWVPALLGPYLERVLDDLVGAGVSVATEPDGAPLRAARSGDPDQVARRRAATALAAGRALGGPVTVRYRPDGRPEIDGGRSLSAAHGAGLTLVVAGTGTLACDVEVAEPRPAGTWPGLLGEHTDLAKLVASATGEDDDVAGTRVWTARECLQKSGASAHAPLVLQPSTRPGWAVFAAGGVRVATFVTHLRDLTDPVVFAVLTDGGARS